MDKESDVMVRVLQDEKSSDKLFDALKDALEKDPIAFYKDFVIPRSNKMPAVVGDSLVTTMTVTQEVARMNRTTAPSPPEETDATNKDT